MNAPDERPRCGWATSDQLYIQYHDTEWGVPERDPIRLFELLILEGAQAGLSWSTILNKRDGYREAFAGFAPEAVAAFGPDDVQRLLADAGIVRNRAKINAAIDNARAWREVEDPVELIWSFVAGIPVQHHWTRIDEIPASTAESEMMSKDLKRRGFRFVGPTICYAFMQSCGLVNDHVTSCFRHPEVEALA